MANFYLEGLLVLEKNDNFLKILLFYCVFSFSSYSKENKIFNQKNCLSYSKEKDVDQVLAHGTKYIILPFHSLTMN
jgi:predicted ABC-type sugar transport system permease subunit